MPPPTNPQQIHPSRPLLDLLRPPHPTPPSHLLALANESLVDLYNHQIISHQAHREARKRFVIARAWFEEMKKKVGRGMVGEGEGGGGGGGGEGEGEGKGDVSRKERELGRAKEMYERAGKEMEGRKGEVERCEGAIRGLKGDVAFLTQLMDERQGGNLRGASRQRGSPRGLGSPRMVGEEKHKHNGTGWKVGSDQETGRDSAVGFAL